jgi:hypothetical protein
VWSCSAMLLPASAAVAAGQLGRELGWAPSALRRRASSGSLAYVLVPLQLAQGATDAAAAAAAALAAAFRQQQQAVQPGSSGNLLGGASLLVSGATDSAGLQRPASPVHVLSGWLQSSLSGLPPLLLRAAPLPASSSSSASLCGPETLQLWPVPCSAVTAAQSAVLSAQAAALQPSPAAQPAVPPPSRAPLPSAPASSGSSSALTSSSFSVGLTPGALAFVVLLGLLDLAGLGWLLLWASRCCCPRLCLCCSAKAAALPLGGAVQPRGGGQVGGSEVEGGAEAEGSAAACERVDQAPEDTHEKASLLCATP